MTETSNGILSVGEPAPAFALNGITREGEIRLEDFLGKSGLFLNVTRGLHCPFCRRHLIQLANAESELKENGIETLVVVSTKPERAHMYLRYRPSPLLIASDPQTEVHRTYGLPRFKVSEEPDNWPRNVNATSFGTPVPDPSGELAGTAPMPETVAKLNEKDNYEPVEGEVDPDIAPFGAGVMLEGRFMIDRGGIVRWIHVEGQEGPQEFAKTPSSEQVMAAARQLA
jgi:peroxiredoxin